jgi:hypothetical protein
MAHPSKAPRADDAPAWRGASKDADVLSDFIVRRDAVVHQLVTADVRQLLVGCATLPATPYHYLLFRMEQRSYWYVHGRRACACLGRAACASAADMACN